MSETPDKTGVITEEQGKPDEPEIQKDRPKIIKHIHAKKDEKKFFWYSLSGRSLDYSLVMELTERQVEDLFVSQMDKTKEGFCEISVNGKKVIFIMACDVAANYGLVSDCSSACWKEHYIVMAYYPDDLDLNISNGVKPPWQKKKRHRMNDDEEEEEEQWTTIVATEELHQGILKAFEKLKEES
jgi:hypothetical protein